ncbi:hypothetical protein AB0F20_09960 [Streptomyces goshikiensis]|uniref:hypothetical protein n=1 Tax=Streptomyces goshikiensis TaxID=1942 RepID=UPI0033E0A57C
MSTPKPPTWWPEALRALNAVNPQLWELLHDALVDPTVLYQAPLQGDGLSILQLTVQEGHLNGMLRSAAGQNAVREAVSQAAGGVWDVSVSLGTPGGTPASGNAADQSIPYPQGEYYRETPLLHSRGDGKYGLLVCPRCLDAHVHLDEVHLVFTEDYEPLDSVSFDLRREGATAQDSLLDVPFDELAALHGTRNRGPLLVLRIVCEDGCPEQRVLLRNHKAHVLVENSAWPEDGLSHAARSALEELRSQAVTLFERARQEAGLNADELPLDDLPSRSPRARCMGLTVKGRECTAYRLPYISDRCGSHASRPANALSRLVAFLSTLTKELSGAGSVFGESVVQVRRQDLDEIVKWMEPAPEPTAAPPQAPRQRSKHLPTTTARFAAHCQRCDHPIDVGQVIVRTSKDSPWIHKACPEDAEDMSGNPSAATSVDC